ncbi:MAG: TFIIB-type zinc ribbon-containing protein [Victivallales bacterium]|nr:TFIIB-type zinc ribbon-containing protein [Victivallales bacterium]
MSNEVNMTVCPNCGKRYELSDFKEDKLVCSACGREIPRFVFVGGVDEAKYVKLYLDRIFDLNERIMSIISPFLIMALVAWLLTLPFSFWWKIIFVVMGCGTPWMIFKEVGCHFKVRRIFKKHNYRFAESVYSFRQWYNSLNDDEKEHVPYHYRDSFIENMENYIKSHAQINTTYEHTSGHKMEKSATSPATVQNNYLFAITKEQQRCDTYDYPPERCPGCGKAYGVADFASDNVQCRYCGKIIKLNCHVPDEEMKAIYEKMSKKIISSNMSDTIVYYVVLIVFCVIIYWQVKTVGLREYFQTWHVITMMIMSLITFCKCLNLNREKKALVSMLKKKDMSDILSMEIYIKEMAGKNSSFSSEELALAEFKKSLFALYRKRGKVIGRY